MNHDPSTFFEAALTAGAILTGFCGTFLSFRIQREANYYRQPAVDFQTEKAKDIKIGLTHFTSAFLLLIVATLLAVIFGFGLPLIAVAGAAWVPTGAVVGGMLASIVMVLAYFLNELIHYGILNRKLAHDAKEWKKGWPIVIVAAILGIAIAAISWVYFWALPALVWVEIEASTVEVDRRLEILPVAEASRGVLDPLNLGVEPLARGVGDAVLKVGGSSGSRVGDRPATPSLTHRDPLPANPRRLKSSS